MSESKWDKLQEKSKMELTETYGTLGKLRLPGRHNKVNTNPIYIKKNRRKK